MLSCNFIESLRQADARLNANSSYVDEVNTTEPMVNNSNGEEVA